MQRNHHCRSPLDLLPRSMFDWRRSTTPIAALGALALALAPTLSLAKPTVSTLWTTKDGVPKVSLPSLSPVVRDVAPAVLTITTEVGAQQSSAQIPFGPFSFRLPVQPGPQKGQGTGFIIHPDGYALTNFHVVENASKIFVNVNDDTSQVGATVVGTDPKTDVALIKLDGDRHDWPVIPFGDSDHLDVGDFVVAIGNPFGLSMSVSSGIISARSRRDIRPSGRAGLYDFLQTDASINPGNSGGPLVNLAGEVVGINSATNMMGDGIGFAIPINLVKRILPELKSDGKVHRSWIGIGLDHITNETYKGFGLDRPRGALVTRVMDESPAAKSGIEPGDVITKFDGKLLKDASELPLLAGHAGVGKEVDVEVMRERRMKKFRLKLEALPSSADEGSSPGPTSTLQQDVLGIKMRTLDSEGRRDLGLNANVDGVLVVDVANGSKAARAGIQPGDVIIKLNGNAIKSTSALTSALKSSRPGELLRMLINRRGTTIFAAVAMD